MASKIKRIQPASPRGRVTWNERTTAWLRKRLSSNLLEYRALLPGLMFSPPMLGLVLSAAAIPVAIWMLQQGLVDSQAFVAAFFFAVIRAAISFMRLCARGQRLTDLAQENRTIYAVLHHRAD